MVQHDLDDAPARGLVRHDLIEEYSAALCAYPPPCWPPHTLTIPGSATPLQRRTPTPCRPPVPRLPRGFNKGRRSQVMSAPVELTAGWQPPIFSKTPEEKAALRQLLSMHVLFSELPSNDIEVPLRSPSPSPSPLTLTP